MKLSAIKFCYPFLLSVEMKKSLGKFLIVILCLLKLLAFIRRNFVIVIFISSFHKLMLLLISLLSMIGQRSRIRTQLTLIHQMKAS